jgi:F-type H+-transporting ATPase subunit b
MIAAETAGNFGLAFILELAALGLVGLFIARKVMPPLRKAMAAKTAEITAQLSAGEEAKKAGAALIESRTAELQASQREAVAIVEQARHGAELVVVEGERQAEEEYERIVRRAAAAVDAARAAVRAEIMSQVGGLVVSATTDVVEAELDSNVQHRLISEAIAATESEAH